MDNPAMLRAALRVLTKIIFCVTYVFTAMVSLMNGKVVGKPCNVYISPDILYKAHVEALRVRKLLGV